MHQLPLFSQAYTFARGIVKDFSSWIEVYKVSHSINRLAVAYERRAEGRLPVLVIG